MTHSARHQPTIYVTMDDYERLSALVEFHQSRRRGALVDFLAEELERAELIAAGDVGPKVVTMNSRVRVRDADTGEIRVVTLVYPGEEDSLRGRLSILTPMGMALLGLREGARMDWRTLDGRRKSLAVLAVEYQPEAHGGDANRASLALP